jgi:hypothetical protein
MTACTASAETKFAVVTGRVGAAEQAVEHQHRDRHLEREHREVEHRLVDRQLAADVVDPLARDLRDEQRQRRHREQPERQRQLDQRQRLGLPAELERDGGGVEQHHEDGHDDRPQRDAGTQRRQLGDDQHLDRDTGRDEDGGERVRVAQRGTSRDRHRAPPSPSGSGATPLHGSIVPYPVWGLTPHP